MDGMMGRSNEFFGASGSRAWRLEKLVQDDHETGDTPLLIIHEADSVLLLLFASHNVGLSNAAGLELLTAKRMTWHRV